MIRLVTLVHFFFVSSSGWAASDCPQKRLEQKFCYVELAGVKIAARDQNLTLTSEQGRYVEKLSVHGPKVDWQKASMFRIGKRLLFDIRIWDSPVGDIELQSLNWILYEVHPRGLKLITQEVAGRRRVADKVLIDPILPVQLQLTEGNKVKWKLGLKEGEF